MSLRFISVLFAAQLMIGMPLGCRDDDTTPDPTGEIGADIGDTGDIEEDRAEDGQFDEDQEGLDDAAGDQADEPSSDPASDATDDEPSESPPDMPLALCDMEPYELLGRTEMGRVIDWENDPTFDLSPALITAMLEEIEQADLPDVSYGCRVVYYRYTTQDRGENVQATAALGLPANVALPEEPMPFVVFEHGTTGFSDPCAPSRDPMNAAPQACLLAALGYIAILPDYIGMVGSGESSTTTHGYLIGEQVAIGSWDAVPGAENLLESELAGAVPFGRTVVLWGGSQGGHAALFTELYGAFYAPEYDVVGVVAAVPPIDLIGLTRIAMESYSPPTEALVALLTTHRRWYGAPDDLNGVFTNTDPLFLADNAEDIVFVEGECSIRPDLEGEDVHELYLSAFIDSVLENLWDDLQPWTCYLTENSLSSTSVPPLRFTPIFTVFSENDDLVVTAPQRIAFDRLCELGYHVEYLECTGANHTQGAVWSLREQIDWIDERLAGEPLDPERICQRNPPRCCSGSPDSVCIPE